MSFSLIKYPISGSGIVTENSDSSVFTGNGTITSPLISTPLSSLLAKVPSQVPNLIGWYDLSDDPSISFLSGGITTGGNINTIADLSGSGNTLTFSNFASQPTYTAGGDQLSTPQFAERPFMRAIGGIQSGDISGGPTSYTVFFVVRLPSNISLSPQSGLIYFDSLTAFQHSFALKSQTFLQFGTQPLLEFQYGSGLQADMGQNVYRPDQIILYTLVFDGLEGGIRINNEPFLPSAVPNTAPLNCIGFGGSNSACVYDIFEAAIYSGIVTAEDQQAIINGLLKKHYIQTADYYMAFGDSITAGHTSGEVAIDPYMIQLQIGDGRLFYNYGLSNTTVPHYSDINNGLSLEDMYYRFISGASGAKKIHIQYGTNDNFFRFEVNIAGWKSRLIRIIQEFINAGVNPVNILLSTPPYNSTQFGLLTLSIAIRQVCSQFGCTLVEFYQGMIDAGLDTQSTPDHVHPDDAISTFLYNTISPLV